MSDTIINATSLNSNEYVHSEIRRKIIRPRFKAVGDLKMKGIHLIADFTPQEAFVFKPIVDAMDYRNNIAEFSTASLTPTEKVKFSKGFKKLFAKDIIKRIKKGMPSIYMINPELIQPKDYNEAIEKWNKL